MGICMWYFGLSYEHCLLYPYILMYFHLALIQCFLGKVAYSLDIGDLNRSEIKVTKWPLTVCMVNFF